MTTHVLLTVPSLAVGTQQPATIDPNLDLCTRNSDQVLIMAGQTETVWNTNFARPLLLMASTGNRTPDLLILSNALSTWPHAPRTLCYILILPTTLKYSFMKEHCETQCRKTHVWKLVYDTYEGSSLAAYFVSCVVPNVSIHYYLSK